MGFGTIPGARFTSKLCRSSGKHFILGLRFSWSQSACSCSFIYRAGVRSLERQSRHLENIEEERTKEATELKEKGKSTAMHYPHSSVLFTDFKGFTSIAEKLTPEELVNELDIFFVYFDKVVERQGLEKIKNIGDA